MRGSEGERGLWRRWRRNPPLRLLIAGFGLALMVSSFPLSDHKLLYLGIALVVVALGVGFEGFGFKLSRTDPKSEPLEQGEGEEIRIQRIVAEVPQKNDDFVGRETEIQALRDSLMSGRRTVLWGLGGVGKSQLAVQYISSYKAEYEGRIFWVRATEATLGSDFAALSLLLGLKEKNEPEQSVVVAAVKGWLREQAPWLLVFDNAEDPRRSGGFFQSPAPGTCSSRPAPRHGPASPPSPWNPWRPRTALGSCCAVPARTTRPALG